jgi:hypothetical protein
MIMITFQSTASHSSVSPHPHLPAAGSACNLGTAWPERSSASPVEADQLAFEALSYELTADQENVIVGLPSNIHASWCLEPSVLHVA